MSVCPMLDGGWGWAAVAAGFINCFLCMGFCRSGGIIYVGSLHKFHGSRTTASWIPMAAVAVLFFSAPVGTALCKRFSYITVTLVGGLLASLGIFVCFLANRIEHVLVGWGLIFGFGSSLAFFSIMALIGQCFKKRLSLSNGIVLSGGAAGAFCVPPLLELLIETYGLNRAMLVTSGVMLHYGVSSFLLLFVLRRPTVMTKLKSQRPVFEEREMQLLGNEKMAEVQFLTENDTDGSGGHHQESRGQLQKNDEEQVRYNGSVAFEPSPSHRNNLSQGFRDLADTLDLTVICNPTFVANCAASGIQLSLLFGLGMLLPDFGEDELNVSRLDASYLVSGCAIADFMARFVSGWLLTTFQHRQTVAYFLVLLTFAALFLIISLTRQFEVVVLGSMIAGVCFANGMLLYIEILATCQSPDKFPMALGLSEFVRAPLLLLVAPTAGILKDATGNYNATLLIFCGLGNFAASLWIFEYIFARRKNNRPLTLVPPSGADR